MSDEALTAVLPQRDRFDARIPFPDMDSYVRGSDKASLLEAAERVGLAVPRQWVAQGPDAVESDAIDGLTFPVVVKPSRSVAVEDGRMVKLGVTYASDARKVRRTLSDLPHAGFPVLLQERIQGEGCGVFLLIWDGQARATFGHRRLREKPPSGGVSTFGESAAPDPDLVSKCERLLVALGWRGVAMVEFKRSAATGVPYVMEVNGRFWGSLQLAIDAGVDFPALLVRAALGETLPPPPPIRPDVRLRWLWGDVDHLIARLRAPGSTNGSGAGAHGNRLSAVREVLGSWRPGERWETLRFSDPRPFLRETVQWVRDL
jgi:predicted ATP-grasp superfamily ATP-dependent carboligase